VLNLDLGKPNGGEDFQRHLISTMNSALGTSMRIRAGFAYATRSGVDELLSSLEGTTAWSEASKFWLLGLHHGITEPDAIRALAGLPRSTVRLATCGLSIKQAIEGLRMFHAKVVAVDSGPKHTISTILAGSANLTRSAIGGHTRNFEAGIAWLSPIEEETSHDFNSWWEEAWLSGTNPGRRSIDSYVDQRTKFRLRNPDILAAEPDATPVSAAHAHTLWIEAGAMSTGGSHNAVDFNEELASFFGPVRNQTRQLTIISGDKRWADRPLTPKTTTLNVNLWRLSLPTVAMGGFDYGHQIIRFTKTTTTPPFEFHIDVADADSDDAQAWQIDTGRHGMIGKTGGGHIFGFM
jgi:hypothetical protein